MIDVVIFCLAINVHYEDGNESPVCQEAIAHSTINRARIRHLDICTVVFQPKQYSWTIRKTPMPFTSKEILRASKIANRALNQRDFTDGATHYHRLDVYPDWAPKMEYLGQWCSHKFYKDIKRAKK